MERYEYNLPVEHWWQVLVNVPPKDLCNVVLTSKHMNTVASLPQLWAGMKVNGAKVRANGLAEFYNINRFKKVKEISFNFWYKDHEKLERFLKEIPGSPLENAHFGYTNFGGVSAEILGSAVSHLHIVNLHNTVLTTGQYAAILKASLSSTTLKNVNLSGAMHSLSPVSPVLLANSISRLQDVNLWNTYLTTEQCVALLKASLSSATLTNVNLDCVNLSKVPAELLANSISRLQVVSLWGTRLTPEQCVALLKASLSSTTLKNVNLHGIDLSHVSSELLTNLISRLQVVNLGLGYTQLTTEQCVAILKASLSSTTLSNVNLSGANLSHVSPILLTNSISRLQDANLGNTYLTTEQCVALLKATLSSASLTHVNLEGVNLSEVPAELLANSISRLQVVNLLNTHLTTEQCAAILKVNHSSKTLTLKHVKRGSKRVINLSEVTAELLKKQLDPMEDTIWPK